MTPPGNCQACTALTVASLSWSMWTLQRCLSKTFRPRRTRTTTMSRRSSKNTQTTTQYNHPIKMRARHKMTIGMQVWNLAISCSSHPELNSNNAVLHRISQLYSSDRHRLIFHKLIFSHRLRRCLIHLRGVWSHVSPMCNPARRYRMRSLRHPCYRLRNISYWRLMPNSIMILNCVNCRSIKTISKLVTLQALHS